MSEPVSYRIRPLDAVRALRASFKDPDDTAQVVRIIDALSGRSGLRLTQRFMTMPGSRAIVARERTILEVLQDREALEAMPVGSLGRTYFDFTGAEQISADGLVEASREATGYDAADDQGDVYGWYMARFRDTHDLWHVLTGYGRDLLGEAALLSFSYAQARHHGFGFIMASVYLRTFFPGAPTPDLLIPGVKARTREMIRHGWRRGRAAGWLPGQDWEALLPEPLDELRRRLEIHEPLVYEPVRTIGAPVLAP